MYAKRGLPGLQPKRVRESWTSHDVYRCGQSVTKCYLCRINLKEKIKVDMKNYRY